MSVMEPRRRILELHVLHVLVVLVRWTELAEVWYMVPRMARSSTAHV